ncbi:hypothetical protein BJY52DRAFT_1187460 [Lactarius psammicola]|nr:hypothetical protein BJY52DRAFT_1187460 [Lactarius psammicola]
MASEPTLVAYVLVASAAMHDVPSAASERASAGNGKLKVQPRWHYARELHKIVDDSDIVLPYSTRATWPGLQPAGRGEGRKQLMSVLNKTGVYSSLKYHRPTASILPFLSADSSTRTSPSTLHRGSPPSQGVQPARSTEDHRWASSTSRTSAKRVLWIVVSPGVIFDTNEGIQRRELSMLLLLRNVVKTGGRRWSHLRQCTVPPPVQALL